MSTAIVYYSMLGNSEMIAEKMALKLGADVIRIEPDKAYPDKGAKKFLWGGKSAVMGEQPVLKPYELNPINKYDSIIIRFPDIAACAVGGNKLDALNWNNCVQALSILNSHHFKQVFRLADAFPIVGEHIQVHHRF